MTFTEFPSPVFNSLHLSSPINEKQQNGRAYYLIGSSDANSLILSLIVKRLLRSTAHHKHIQFLIGIISDRFGRCWCGDTILYYSSLLAIRSFLSDRMQRIAFGDRVSALVVLMFGEPQGSVLGPLLFLLYIAEAFDVVAAWGATAHFYADDGQ